MKIVCTFTIIALISLTFAGCPLPKDDLEMMSMAVDSTDYEKAKEALTESMKDLLSEIKKDRVQLNSLEVIYEGLEIRAKNAQYDSLITNPVTLE